VALILIQEIFKKRKKDDRMD
ncbi:TPA: lipoprotein signal peptidase, partial [Campylobacter jejuni]